VFERWINYLRERTETDHDNVILIDGYEGTGKSTIAMHLMDRLTPDWTPEENIVLRWVQGRDALKNLPRKTTILIDEGANVLFSRDSMRGANRWFGKILFQCRQLNNTLILCIPNKRWMDAIGREHRSQYWIHNHQRGKATVLERRENWVAGTVYYQPAFDFGYGAYPKSDPRYLRYLTMKSEAMTDLGEAEAPRTYQEQTAQADKAIAQGYG
jgi:hypothetical protein